jgi:hypothetical protein
LTRSKNILQEFTKRGTPASNQGSVTDRGALPCHHGYQEKKPDAGKAAFLIKLNLVLKHWRLKLAAPRTEQRALSTRLLCTKKLKPMPHLPAGMPAMAIKRIKQIGGAGCAFKRRSAKTTAREQQPRCRMRYLL